MSDSTTTTPATENPAGQAQPEAGEAVGQGTAPAPGAAAAPGRAHGAARPAAGESPRTAVASNGGAAVGAPAPAANGGPRPSIGDRRPAAPEMGTFDESGEYHPRAIIEDDLGDVSFEDAVNRTIVEFDDGDLVTGTVVKVDKDEVLLDIGFKSEGVIPSRELSIRHDVDAHKEVQVGEQVEALVLQKEDKEGRLVLSKKRAQYERAWGTIEKV
ncbi:MAG TPA: S1 RNA-binding domain-containing protein, partial [Acidimicrobiales bacterium]|nr:S1 RNA-binding domain-containing protein [Acidimicrobiales bacterium]